MPQAPSHWAARDVVLGPLQAGCLRRAPGGGQRCHRRKGRREGRCPRRPRHRRVRQPSHGVAGCLPADPRPPGQR